MHRLPIATSLLSLLLGCQAMAAEPAGKMPPAHSGPDAAVAKAAGIDWMRPYNRTPATTMKRTATGFFRVEKIDGKWWFIDPKGFALWGAGINGGGPEAVYTSDMWGNNPTTEPYLVTRQQTVSAVAGPGIAAWVDYCRGILDGAGMQIMASGAMDQVAGPLPTCRLIDFSEWFYNWNPNGTPPEKFADQGEWHDIVNMWHPDWPAHCEKLAARLMTPLKDSPWVVGWFLNNERSWAAELPMAELAWKLPESHPAKQALVAQAQKAFADIAACNAAFGTAYADWAAFAADTTPHMPKTQAGGDFLTAFGGASIERFYAVATAAMRKADPNHLILGSRDWVMLHGSLIPAHLKALGKYCDVVSYNAYFFSSPTQGIDANDIRQWRTISAMAGDKPILISEWGINAAETKCVMQCYQMVQTRQQRAELYASTVKALAAEPSIIGNLWFCFDEGYDGNPDDLSGSENRGWLRRDLKPYPELQAAATTANREAQKIRAATGAQPGVRGDLNKTAWSAALPPVNAALAATRRFTVGALTFDLADSGRLAVNRAGVPAGEVSFQVAQNIPAERWPFAETLETVIVRQDAVHTVLDLTVAFTSGQGDAGMRKPGPCPTWKGQWRLWLPRDGSGDWFATQNLWITNTSPDAFLLASVFHNFLPALGGSLDGDDTPGSFLTRRSESRFADRAAGLGLASWSTEMSASAWRTADQAWSGSSERALDPISRRAPLLLPGQTWTNPYQSAACFTVYAFPTGTEPPTDPWANLDPALSTRFGPR